MKIAQSVYYNSPVPVQNILASLQGYYLNRRRTGGRYAEFCSQIRERSQWPLERHLEFQNHRFLEMVRHMYRYVPFYRKLFSKLNIDPQRVAGLEDISSLPYLTKEEVRANNNYLRAHDYLNLHEMTIHTTGTTGTPLQIYCDDRARQLNYSFFNMYLESIGVDYSRRKATIGGRVIVGSEQKEPPFWRLSYPTKTLYLSSYHLHEDNLRSYVEKLKEFDPHWIDAYPSSIFAIAKFMLEKGIGGCCPQAIITSAETLFPEQRQVIESAFGCRVFDQYGSAEMCVFAGQCSRGKYHLRPDYALVEFIKDDRPAAPGELAEIVCTGFVNWRMPLLRYRIGDVGAFSHATCECGLQTPILESLQGRVDDVVVSKTGKRIWRLSPILKGFPIKEALYVQKKKGELILQVVKGETFGDETIENMISEVKARVGGDFDIEVQVVDRIVRGPGAKSKAVISMLGQR